MKLFLSLLIFSSFLPFSFASENIDVSLSPPQVQVGDNFELTITVNTTEFNNQALQFEIPGIENFEMFSQSQSLSYESTNGQTRGLAQYVLDLRTTNSGVFQIGPVTVVSNSLTEVDDDILEIQVSENIGVPQFPNNGGNTVPEVDGTQNQPQKLSRDDIKDIRNKNFPYVSFFIIFIIFFGGAYILTKYLLDKKNSNTLSILEEVITNEPQNLQMELYFEELEKSIGTISSQKFFRTYNRGVRKILSEKGVVDAHSASLEEIIQITSESKLEALAVFKKSYNLEFSHGEIDIEMQHQFIKDIQNTL